MPAVIRIGSNTDSSFVQCGNSSHGWADTESRITPMLVHPQNLKYKTKTPSDEVRRKAGDSQEGIISKPGVFIICF